MRWASHLSLDGSVFVAAIGALISFVAFFLAIAPTHAETVQFYCRHVSPSRDMLVALDYATGEVRWNTASNVRRGLDWWGPAKARVTKYSIRWTGIEDGSQLMYRIDTTSGEPEVCADSGCWMSCETLR